MAKDKSLYKTLDVDEKATQEEIKEAFRKRARETHPDHHPEKADEFNDVSRAYAVLRVPQKRAQYDKGGDADDLSSPKDARHEAMAAVNNIFLAAVSELGEEIWTTDIVKVLLMNAKEIRARTRDEIRGNRETMKKWKKIKRKMKHKGDGPDLFTGLCNDQIQYLELSIESKKYQVKVGDELVKLLNEYEWDMEAGMFIPITAASSGIFGGSTTTW